MKKLLVIIITAVSTLSIGTATVSAAGSRQYLSAENSRNTCYYLESNCHFRNVDNSNICYFFQSGCHFTNRNVDSICGYNITNSSCPNNWAAGTCYNAGQSSAGHRSGHHGSHHR